VDAEEEMGNHPPTDIRPDRRADTHLDRATRYRDLASWVVGASLILIAAHLLIDSFLDLRPGTGPGDHLVSGTIPVLAVGLIGVTYIYRRTGAAATMLALLGVAVVIGAAGAPVADLLEGGVHASTLTGTAGAVAGLTLIGTGVIELFRARRRGGPRWRRWGRRTARAGLGTVLVLYLAVPIGMGYVIANRTGSIHPAADLGRPYEDITLRTDDGLRIAASYVPSQNRAAIIVFPGRSGDHVASRVRMLVSHGYGALVLDERGHGASDGDPNLLGWSGEIDIRAAIHFLQARPDVDASRIGGLGLSVGGELMLQTAARDEGLRAVVSEGAGSRWVGDDLHTPFPAKLVQLPFMSVATAATAVFSDSPPPPRLDHLIPQIAPRPIMLIWTPKGIGGEWFNPRYFDLAGAPKTIWEIPESAHTDGLATRPAEYEDRVVGFFDDALAVAAR
jgi:uncharacterized protein